MVLEHRHPTKIIKQEGNCVIVCKRRDKNKNSARTAALDYEKKKARQKMALNGKWRWWG